MKNNIRHGHLGEGITHQLKIRILKSADETKLLRKQISMHCNQSAQSAFESCCWTPFEALAGQKNKRKKFSVKI